MQLELVVMVYSDASVMIMGCLVDGQGVISGQKENDDDNGVSSG